jgi:hypothetical protein
MRSSSILLLCFALTHAGQHAGAQETPNPKQAPAPQPEAEKKPEVPLATLLLPEATPVKLKLLHALNSKTVVVDDPLNFALAEDVLVNAKIIAKAGAVAIGRVRQAKPARTLGRGAQLSLEMQYLKIGRVRVPLRGSQAQSGANKKGDTVALVVVFGLSGLIKHGSEIEVKEGSVFTAYVDQDTELPLQPEPTTEVP